MTDRWPTLTVRALQDDGVLRVEDGNHGESRPRQNEFVSHGGVSFIRATDLRDGVVNFRTAEQINEAARARITKGIGRPGDILFSHKGTVGKLARAESDAPPFVCSPQTTFWRALDEERLDSRFLYAFMRSRLFSDQWRVRKGETDMADYVSLTAQRTFKVPLPPVTEQRRIGDVLEPLDSQIHEARLCGEQVHDLAERLFQSWFVDLDPARIGAPNERATVTPQLAAVMPRVLPNTGDDLPEGWTLGTLRAIANYRNGIPMQKYPPEGESWLPVLKIAQLRDGSLLGADRVTDQVPTDVIVTDGDVVFSWSGSLMVRLWCGGCAALNQHLFKVTSIEFPRWFYYFWTRAHLAEFQAIAADKQTTMGHIKREHLDDAKVYVPPSKVLEAADETIGPMLDRYVVGELYARRLESLRDQVLASLMSGDIEIDASGGSLVEVPA